MNLKGIYLHNSLNVFSGNKVLHAFREGDCGLFHTGEEFNSEEIVRPRLPRCKAFSGEGALLSFITYVR